MIKAALGKFNYAVSSDSNNTLIYVKTNLVMNLPRILEKEMLKVSWVILEEPNVTQSTVLL